MINDTEQTENNTQEKTQAEHSLIDCGANDAQTQTHYFFNADCVASNFYPSVFQIKEEWFVSVEHLMMFSKAKLFKDEAVVEKIRLLVKQSKQCQELLSGGSVQEVVGTPEALQSWTALQTQIKRLGRAVKNYEEEVWAQRRFRVVRRAVREKIEQNEAIKNWLVSCPSRSFCEASPYDRIWGCGLTAEQAKQRSKTQWPGQNLLGMIWEQFKNEPTLAMQGGAKEKVGQETRTTEEPKRDPLPNVRKP